MSLKQQVHKEVQAMGKLERVEAYLLAQTAQALCDEIVLRLDKRTVVTVDSKRSYAALYTDAMRFAWLYGNWHVLQLINAQIELAESPQMPFQEALAYLESQVPMTQREFRDLDANIKLRSFTIASVSCEEAVQRVQGLYEAALAQGQSRPETMQQVGRFLSQAGVSTVNPYYLELHYRNNMMSAYNAGRWAQIEGNDIVEYLIYLAVMDDGTTKLCRHLDQTTKPKGDPFWRKYWPPNHHKCRSTVSPLAATQYDDLPEDVKKRSSQVTNARIEDDPIMASEHNFKSSPNVAMQRLPGSLVAQAKAFDQVKSILNYSATQSATLLSERVVELGQKPVSATLVKAMKQDGVVAEDIEELVQQDAFFGLGDLGNGSWLPEVWFFWPQSGDNWLWGRAAAFEDGGLRNVSVVTAEQRDALMTNAKRL